MKTADFNFDLPQELIAQQPMAERTDARMMVLHRADGRREHRTVRDLPEYLIHGDLLVVNNTQVIPARVFGHKPGTGGRVEILLLEEVGPNCWDVLCRASRRPLPGATLMFARNRLKATVLDSSHPGHCRMAFESREPLMQILEEEGIPPLPPYIRREPPAPAGTTADEQNRKQRSEDLHRYQTVYARVPGAVAAPTAGLHLTQALLDVLGKRGVQKTEVTLHVGIGTFKPVKVADPAEHRMDPERYEISPDTSRQINEARAAGHRIIAVGSTSARTLETVADATGVVSPGSGRSDLFIYPPYRFKIVSALLTNFHLPCSTLLMMVSALAGYDMIREAYREAIAQRYRFYSYGDCMLIL